MGRPQLSLSLQSGESCDISARRLSLAYPIEVLPYHYSALHSPRPAMTAILDNKNPSAASVFRPSALLREARRQKGLAAVDVPSICILDPDGDIVRHLRRTGAPRRFEGCPCSHTTLHTLVPPHRTLGIVGGAAGAPFAVLVAEQLSPCGCRLLLSIPS